MQHAEPLCNSRCKSGCLVNAAPDAGEWQQVQQQVAAVSFYHRYPAHTDVTSTSLLHAKCRLVLPLQLCFVPGISRTLMFYPLDFSRTRLTADTTAL
jgi:hypothetical protein